MTASSEFNAMYRGICVTDNDPEGLLRIKAIVPQLFGNSDTQTDWAWPSIPPGAGVTPPAPGTGVWISFEGGDPEHPIWAGVWSNDNSNPLAFVPLSGTVPGRPMTGPIEGFSDKGGEVFDVRAYEGTGSDPFGSSFAAAAAAAMVNGGTILLPPSPNGGIYDLYGRVVIPGNVGIVGQGAGWQPAGGPTPGAAPFSSIRCRSDEAGLDFESGSGGACRDFTIDGNNIALQPLRDGVSITEFPQDRKWDSVYVVNSAQDGWSIIGTQNASYHDCRTVNAARDSLLIDGNAGGLNFFNYKDLAFNNRYSINAPNLLSGGPYGNITGDITFVGGILDFGPSQVQQGKINLVAAASWSFPWMPIVGIGCTGPLVQIDCNTCNKIDFNSCLFYGPNSATPHIPAIKCSGSGLATMINVSGVEFVEGDISLLVDVGAAPSIRGWGSVQDFTTNKAVSNSYDINVLLANPTGIVGKWITPTLLGTWTTVPGQQPIRFRITQDGNQVEIEGITAGGVDGTAVFSLPEFYRPSQQKFVIVPMNGGPGIVAYNSSTFEVSVFQFPGASSTAETILDSVFFTLDVIF